jgi:cation:H+ antiporter
VSLQAALNGYPEIAVGNVVGSNISNILLVLAITAIIFPIAVPAITLKRDWTIMMIVSCIFFLFTLNGELVLWEGLLLLLLLTLYIFNSIRLSKRNHPEANGKNGRKKPSMPWVSLLILVASVAGLALGADLLVNKAALIAEALGISKRVISISMVAVGTSIPELATSVIAALKKQTGISLGNIIGSNLMNILSVLGITGVITPISIEKTLIYFDIPWMLGTGFFLLILIVIPSRFILNRWKGIIMVLVYLLYLYLIF